MHTTHHTWPYAPEPIAFKFLYLTGTSQIVRFNSTRWKFSLSCALGAEVMIGDRREIEKPDKKVVDLERDKFQVKFQLCCNSCNNLLGILIQ